MAKSSSILTSDQQAQLAAWSVALRSSEGEMARLIARVTAINASYNSTNGASTLLGLLQSTDTVDDLNGLAGAGPMTKQNLIDRVADIQLLIAAWPTATYLPLWTQAVGPTNVLP